ncbi:alpha-L-fucosidase [Horticoccus luteus]|uniref:alpha-L-fucosidase n=1 Tax=Horticoccus luteus TaxID=2862869 RepID=A0A8F9TY74_9BACT|nr:alpha-L-fucosidase [Horticoccus luteus]QYM79712.1 alpha-L-fucosidase [Horticoccus luteus]
MRAVDISAVKQPTRRPAPQNDPLRWWRESRFGMFIHWGLYAIPAGVWQGQRVPYIGEWMMFREKIPVATYAALAAQFHPRHFDAAAWVRLAKQAGMRYLVITAKHHDGFAMYRTSVNRYNVVDATPWHHDPMVDLARECRRQGVRLCFYYSQDLDWHHPDGAWNDWDYPAAAKNPARYLREKVKPQLRELLTRYGPVGMIWFDTPLTLTKAQSASIRRFVKKLQPRCLVSGRIGHGLGDYNLPRDNFLPPGRLEGDWETCATLNHTWGFKTHDHEWKSAENLITTLVDLVSKGANYLLNIGPDADGVVPAPSVQRLRAVGAWLERNGDAIYGTSPSPFRNEFSWGRITTKGRRLFLHFFSAPPKIFHLHGLRTRVRTARALGDARRAFATRQTTDAATGLPILAIDFTGLRFRAPVTVVALDLAAAPDVEPQPLQQPDATVTLITGMARLGTDATAPTGRIGGNGLTENWRSTDDWLEWDFTLLRPGAYEVNVVTTHQHLEPWSGGHTLRLTADGQTLRHKTTSDAILPSLRSAYYPQIATSFGRFNFANSGRHTLRLQATRLKLPKKNKTLFSDGGMQFVEIRLTPVS